MPPDVAGGKASPSHPALASYPYILILSMELMLLPQPVAGTWGQQGAEFSPSSRSSPRSQGKEIQTSPAPMQLYMESRGTRADVTVDTLLQQVQALGTHWGGPDPSPEVPDQAPQVQF